MLFYSKVKFYLKFQQIIWKIYLIDLNEDHRVNSLEAIYGMNLLELTCQHKIHETTVDRINKVIENIFNQFIKTLKVT